MQISARTELQSAGTRGSVEELGIAEGDEVNALITSTEVMLAP